MPGYRMLVQAARSHPGALLALAVYLTFYEGVWKVLDLMSDCSLGSVLARIAFIYLGYRLAVWLAHLRDVPGRLSWGARVVGLPVHS